MRTQPPEATRERADPPNGDPSLIRFGSVVLFACLLFLAALLLIHPKVPTDASHRDHFRTTLDINTATTAQLGALPNIGPALAERIASDRETRGRFDSLDDLDRVPGIGPRTIEALRPHAAAR